MVVGVGKPPPPPAYSSSSPSHPPDRPMEGEVDRSQSTTVASSTSLCHASPPSLPSSHRSQGKGGSGGGGGGAAVTGGGTSAVPRPKRIRMISVGLSEMVERRKADGHLTTNVVSIESWRNGRRIEQVYKGVHDGHELGQGVAGIVRLVTHKQTGAKYACKCLNLSRLHPSAYPQLREEINIMSQLDHPNIARLHEVYQGPEAIYLVQDLCSGGELFDRLEEQPDFLYDEVTTRLLVKQMLSALRYLHSKGIVHRDLKLENFLFSAKDSLELYMIDFGLSKHFNQAGDVHHEIVGTPYTVAPEVINGDYNERCDLWAIGVMTFATMGGDAPFGGMSHVDDKVLLQMRKNIQTANYAFEPANIWDTVSDQAKAFIAQLLVLDPSQRPSAQEAQQHPWLQQGSGGEGAPPHPRQDKGDDAGGETKNEPTQELMLKPSTIEAMQNFRQLPIMKRLVFEVFSFTLFPEQTGEMRKEFAKLDLEESGDISMDALMEVLCHRHGLTTDEVTEIFQAIKIDKVTETRIQWHEFLTACLSQCHVDGRNLRLAFDRMDTRHTETITFEELMEIVACDAANHDEGRLREMWAEAIQEYQCANNEFTYPAFCCMVQRHLPVEGQ